MNGINNTIGVLEVYKNPVGVATSSVGLVRLGQSVLELQGMSAKIQDINNIPPSLTKWVQIRF